MVTYKYTAISRDGQKITGVIEGYNELDAADRIKQSCDIILNLTEVKDEGTGILNRELWGDRLNPTAFTMMCSQFAIILQSGIPIGRTVHLIADKTTDKPLQRVLKQVADDVESGRSISASFEERGGKLMPPTFVETIRAGEESGNLDSAFETMYHHFDKQVKLSAKLRGAMIYPAFVLTLAVVVVIVMMVRVVPTFMAIFESLDAELPLITRMLIGISWFFQKTWLYMAIIAVVLFIAYKIYSNTEEGRLRIAELALKLPLFGNINELTAASQFANSMTMMLSSGLPMTRAISISAKVISNYYISQKVGQITGMLQEGQTVGASLRSIEVMPDILVDMTAVGEETGEMERTLRTIAGYYDAELEAAIQAALAKIEPATLIVLGGVAGFIVIAIYMAMFSMYGAM